jgi:hypothetical protein
LEGAFGADSPVASTVFGGRAFVASYGQQLKVYDGRLWFNHTSQSVAENPPAFLTAINRRLAAAGFESFPTRVWLSRVDNWSAMPDDEDPNDENVLRAGYIDVGNMLNSGDSITGIAGFEWNRLAIFTNNQAVIYMIDPNIERWSILDQVAINVGCISHNTICNSGRDLLFCSRTGVHSVVRSRYTSISVYSRTLSDKISILYKQLVSMVDDTRKISATWDQDTGRYHIFFRVSDHICYRLTAMIPDSDEEEPRWSMATYLHACCADTLAGSFIYGTPGGIYRSASVGQELFDGVPVEMEFTTPVLWFGSMSQIKDSYGYSIHITGSGRLELEFLDDQDEKIHSDVIDIDESDAEQKQPGPPIWRQFDRKMEKRFLGLRLKAKTSGTGLIRVAGFSINIRS